MNLYDRVAASRRMRTMPTPLRDFYSFMLAHDTPFSRSITFSWAAQEIGSGGGSYGLDSAVNDLAFVASRNLADGLMGLAMGGDLAPVGGVYSIRNPSGDVVRVGRSNNLTSRAGDYRRDPNYFDLDFQPEYYTDDYATQRGLERVLFDQYDHPPMNVYNPISPKNGNISNYLNAAYTFLSDLFGGN